MQRIVSWWLAVRSSLWFIPVVMVFSAVGLAVLLVEAEGWVDSRLLDRWPRLFGAGAAGSRGVLTAVATSMATVAGVVFSITIAALAQASAQYTPRVLRNFMRDRANQSVLGVFVGIFAYCLVVLRTVRGGDEGAFVPSLAVFAAVLLALVGVGFFIFFIHHTAASLQAAYILAAVSAETARSIDRLFPDQLGDEAAPADAPPGGLTWHPVPSAASGQVRSVDEGGLLRVAREHAAVVRMECGVGEFVAEGAAVASVGVQTGREPPDLAGAVGGCFDVGRQRTVEQDAAFGLRQAVDIALKALSPGVNDTTTAVQAIDHLSAVLRRLAGRRIQSPYRSDGGELRVIARRLGFADFLGLAFDEIRRSGAGNPRVLARLLHALRVVAGGTTDPARRAALTQQAEAVAEVVRRADFPADDRAALEVDLERSLAELRVAT